MTRKRLLLPMAGLFALLVVFTSIAREDPNDAMTTPLVEMNPDDDAFEKVMSVVTHKRCMNCHPADDYPRQGEDSHLHNFGVQRGLADHGTEALQCGTCHQTANNDFSGVPGAPHWGLAPKSMGWQGMDKYEIAQAMLDRSKNGNRSKADIEHHLTEDPLVLWVFEPGVNSEGKPREQPPLTKDEWVTAVKTWIAGGAKVPTKE